ncbi:MAG: RluA family pseudouridine synthase [Solirubrobacterales bacterium]|nr:RluA family pseudouridine synthase [Solirubrobacterales bacterium]
MRISVDAANGGERLDAQLAGPLGSRARAQRLIAAGQVTVNGAVAAKSAKPVAGSLIEIDESDLREIRADDGPAADFRIAYEDDSLLVVDKPAGVVVHPARGHSTGTLVQALAGRAGGGDDPERPGIVHRLDRDTSGLLVVARDEATHRALRAAMSKREVTREYLALVNGRPTARTGTIDAPIGRDRRNRTKVSLDTDRPRSAVTHFEIEQSLPESTLLRVTLDTGRTHQIRAHLEAIGLPVVGDQTYGDGASYGLERQFLHAARLRFKHPSGDGEIDVVSQLPPDLSDALTAADSGL